MRLAPGAGRRLTSRTNTVFSIPMLFFMGAASHYPSLVKRDSFVRDLLVVVSDSSSLPLN